MTATKPDDHGVLCDASGEPIAYRTPGHRLPTSSLEESQLWPDDMLMVNAFRDGRVVKIEPRPGQHCEAEFYAERLEKRAARKFRAIPCAGDHSKPTVRCSDCGAVR